MQLVFYEISKRWRHAYQWADNPTALTAPPSVNNNNSGILCYDDEYCASCEALMKLRSRQVNQKTEESTEIQDDKKTQERLKEEEKKRKREEKRNQEILKARAAFASKEQQLNALRDAANESDAKRAKKD